MSLKRSMPAILKEYRRLEKQAYMRGGRKLTITRDDILKDKTLYLEFPNGHFRTIIAFGSLNYVMRIEQAAAEINRTLKPGGKLAAAVWTKTGRDYKDGIYYFPNSEFVRAFKWLKFERLEFLHLEAERVLLGFVGTKK